MAQHGKLELFFKIKRLINCYGAQKFKTFNLGLKQAGLIRHLGSQGTLSASHLATLSLSDPAAITRSVDVLVKQGYVEKIASPIDRRSWDITLTPEGKRLFKKMSVVFDDLEETVFGVLLETQQKDLMRLFETLMQKHEELKEKRKDVCLMK